MLMQDIYSVQRRRRFNPTFCNGILTVHYHPLLYYETVPPPPPIYPSPTREFPYPPPCLFSCKVAIRLSLSLPLFFFFFSILGSDDPA